MAHPLILADATVTVCHSRTRDLSRTRRSADVVVAAVGGRSWSGRLDQARGDRHRRGVNRRDDGKLVGDVEFIAAATRAGGHHDRPGWGGPMTIAMLLGNTLHARGDACSTRDADDRPSRAAIREADIPGIRQDIE